MFKNFKAKVRGSLKSSKPPRHTSPAAAGQHAPGWQPESSEPSIEPQGASDRIGLFLVARSRVEPDTQHGPVDIVAVHGLDGSPFGTWRDHTGKTWLEDALPDSVPGSQVYTFGYASKTRSNPSLASFPDFARSLLDSVRNVREQSNEALVFAHLDQKQYGSLLDSTVGVVFLGTPHRGSGLADIATTFASIVNLFTTNVITGGSSGLIRNDLLRQLSYDAESLQELHISASNLFSRIQIATFYETLPTPPLNIPVVNRHSAIMGIPNEHVVPLSLNHRNISKLSVDPSACLSVCSEIQRMHVSTSVAQNKAGHPSSRSSSLSELSELEQRCMKLFSAFDIREYLTRLPEPLRGTCAWIRSHPMFVSWADHARSALLWLTGHPGCGKTVLSYSVAKSLEHDSQHVLVYFCDNKITAQRDAKAILIGLIFQLVYRNRKLIRYIRREFEVCGTNMVQSFAILWSVFKNMIMNFRSRTIYVVIDALDECEASSRHYFVDAVEDLVNSPSQVDASSKVKFLFTSRPMLDLEKGSRGNMRHLLPIDDGESGHLKDLQHYIHQRVMEVALKHRWSDQTRSHLLQTLQGRADRTFLWIHVILSSLEESFLSSASDLDVIISTLPPSLESTYLDFLSRIPRGAQATAQRLLGLILASSRPLHLDEMNYALSITESHRLASDVSRDCQPALDRTIQGILGPLVRVSGEKVSLVHQTAKDFLLMADTDLHQPQSYEGCPGIQIITPKSAALQMATTCLQYLLLDDFAEGLSSPEISPIDGGFDEKTQAVNADNMWEEESLGLDLFAEAEDLEATISRTIASQHTFYSYAASQWFQHYSICESVAPQELRNSVMSLINSKSTAGQTWLKFLRSEAIDAVSDYPSQVNSLILSACFCLEKAVEDALSSGNHAQHEKDEALFWSAKYGNNRIVTMLLNSGALPEYQGAGRKTALMVSAAAGHLPCVQALLADKRCDVNARGEGGRNALSLAAGNGHDHVTKYLLQVEAIQAHDADKTGATAFVWAAGGGQLATLSTLAKDPRIDVNKQDRNGRTALSWAAGDGLSGVVLHLLKSVKGIDPNLPDQTGRTPLSWAAGNGHKNVVEVLMASRRVDKHRLDDDKRSPISWAAGHGHEGALRTLLSSEEEPRGLEHEDVDGWTPLAWAVQCDAPGVVEALIDAGARNLEKGPRTVLSWAVEYGHLPVVQVLLARGADPESARDKIPFAQSMGGHHVEIVEELLKHLNVGKDG